VIDGSMAIAHWFHSPSGEAGLAKVDYDERAYSNQDTVVDQLYSFDAVFDLASAAADLHVSSRGDEAIAFADGLRRRFEATAGRISDERWFLYQLIVLRSYRQFLRAMQSELAEGALPDLPRDVAALLEPRSLAEELEHARDAMSMIDQQYWSRLMPRGGPASGAAHVCAIDIDGVLETGRLGYSGVTPLGALSLRSLIAHGYSPVLVTGRCAGDVRDRCRAFGLTGGVAEYGAALYIASGDRVVDLRGPADRRDLDGLRSALESIESVYVARRYRYAVRASLLTDGGPRPLPEDVVRVQLAALGLSGRVRVNQGWRQTDFIVSGVDKGSGVRALLHEIGAREHRVAFAAGDGVEDVPVLKLADLAVGPRNADRPVAEAGARLMRGRYQSGLAQGIELLIGHRPGACDRCRPPAPGVDEALLVAALSAQEEGRMVKLGQALRLATLLVRAR
jgi:hydroxymethylpyrimidine pyrophosphatase-like HAD family hydrolase